MELNGHVADFVEERLQSLDNFRQHNVNNLVVKNFTY